MADFADLAADREMLDRDLSIASVRKSAPVLPPCGQCYNCLAAVPDGLRFCDADCRDDWWARKNAEVRRAF